MRKESLGRMATEKIGRAVGRSASGRANSTTCACWMVGHYISQKLPPVFPPLSIQAGWLADRLSMWSLGKMGCFGGLSGRQAGRPYPSVDGRSTLRCALQGEKKEKERRRLHEEKHGVDKNIEHLSMLSKKAKLPIDSCCFMNFHFN